jgi:hypothetical protein
LLDEILDGVFNPLERIAQGKLAGQIHDGEVWFLAAKIIVYDHGCDAPFFGFTPARGV